MQFVNDDMDELFRKAADNYPLKTDNADWNKVLQGLQKGDDEPNEPDNKKTDYRKYLWLLLLLPLAFVCTKYIGNNKDSNKETVNKTAPAQTTGIDKKDANVASVDKNTTKENSDVQQGAKDKITNEPVITESKTVLNNGSIKGDNRSVSNNRYASQDKGHANAGYPQKGESVSNILNGSQDQTKNPTTTPNEKATTENKTPQEKTAGEIVTQATPPANKEEEKKENTETQAKPAEKKKQEKLKLKKGFYLSLLGGPDISTINLQQVQKVGYSIGLIGGYRITGNLGVELGVLWDKKQYYTDGDKFNTGKIYLPPNVTIKDVAGNCTMIEIPVAARYDFAIKKSSNFFTTLGMSSYLMAKEKYDYMYDHNNNVYGVHREYNSTSKNWFSIIHASVGYEKKIGTIGNLRVEPYLKIPISGVGIGSLPISSVGMYIGVTKHF